MSVESLRPFEGDRPVWRFSASAGLLTAAVVALSVVPFWDGVTDMWNVWLYYPEYSHSLLIPPLALFLVWQQKDRLERENFTGSWWGVALIFLAGALLMLGQLGTLFGLIEYGYLVFLYGLVLAFTGPRAFRLLAGPLGILLFMIPLPSFIFTNLSQKLQLLSSLIGAWFMRLFGISVYLEGNVIDLGGYQLQVAEACDGLRYLFPLLTLGFLMAYFYRGRLWKRITLVISCIPITVLMNSFRIGTIGFMVEHWGIQMAEGFLHSFQGWLVFMVSAAMMLAEIAILNGIGPEHGTWRELFGVEFPAESPRGVPRLSRPLPRQGIVAACLLVTFSLVTLIVPRPAEIVPARAGFVDFPMQLGPWSGKNGAMEGVYLDQLKLDDYLMAEYSNAVEPRVDVYMAYYNSQRKGEAVHSPRACLPGGGWQFSSFEQRTLNDVPLKSGPLRVNRTVISLGNQRQLVYYWFQQRGRIVTNELAVKGYIFWDAITRHRTDGGLVRLITALPPGSQEADADKRLTEVAVRLEGVLGRYLPD